MIEKSQAIEYHGDNENALETLFEYPWFYRIMWLCATLARM